MIKSWNELLFCCKPWTFDGIWKVWIRVPLVVYQSILQSYDNSIKRMFLYKVT